VGVRRGLELGALRRDFDRSFALPPPTDQRAAIELLLLRVGSDPYAIRVSEITGIASVRAASYLPSTTPALEGLVGIRGALVPLFGLSALLGQPAPAEASRWLVLVGRDEPLALGFQAFDGYHKLLQAALSASRRGAASASALSEVVELDGRVVPVIGIAALVLGIKESVARERSGKED
jgi:purine-binding chemotaxis protein CheW